MIRKIIVRTFFVSAALVCLVVVSGLVAGYLAFQQPEFYATLRSKDVTAVSEDELKQQASEFEQWIKNSLTAQHLQRSSDVQAQAYDPAADTHKIQVTERQLNGLLVSRRSGAGDMQHPRLCIEEDTVRLGAEFVIDGTTLVFSAAVKPVVGADGRLYFAIQSGHVGRLRIPLNTLLSFMDSNVKQLSNGLELQANGSTPTLIFDQTTGPKAPKVQSIICKDGLIAVTFQAPVLPDAGDADRISKSAGTTSL